jgi:hypothetical protein
METDIRDEARRLGDRLTEGAAPARLMGGLAVWLRCRSVRRPPFARIYADLDLVAPGLERVAIAEFLEGEGYVPDRRFNTLYGSQRLYFAAPTGAWTVDVIFDRLAMSHELDLRDRLATAEPTLPLADLLLSKLQIWEINRKDLGDAICLLADHPLGGTDPDHIDVARLTSVLASDWGFCHTVERNLARVAELAADERPVDTPCDVLSQVRDLQAAIASAPKSL